jgi:hypothetical protein
MKFSILIFSILALASSELTVYERDSLVGIEKFDDTYTYYGSIYPEVGLGGLVVKADPFDACEPIKKAPKLGQKSFFALINHQDQKCKVEKQISNAQEAGFKAAIIIDDQLLAWYPYNVVLAFPKYHNSSVMSLLVSHETGHALAQNYTFPNTDKAFVMITEQVSYAVYTYIMFAMLVACLVVAVIFVCCYFKLLQVRGETDRRMADLIQDYNRRGYQTIGSSDESA